MSVCSNSEVNSWGRKKGPLKGSKTPTLNTRICFSKQEHLAFRLLYWLFIHCLWGGVRVKGLASCEVAGRLRSWKCHFSFHTYQSTGYAFFGMFTRLNFSWELWSRSSLNVKKRWFTVRDEIHCPNSILTNPHAACKTSASCWYPISFSAMFCENTGLTWGACCRNCVWWLHIRIKKKKSRERKPVFTNLYKCLRAQDAAVLTEIFLQAETLVLLGEGPLIDQYSDGGWREAGLGMQVQHQNKTGFQCCTKGESRVVVCKILSDNTARRDVSQIRGYRAFSVTQEILRF